MEIIQKVGYANLSKRSKQIKYLVIHYTAGTTSKTGTAKNVALMFSKKSQKASADWIVDDTTVVQYNPNPLKYNTWAVGGSKYKTKGGCLYGVASNSNTISIEICSSLEKGYVYKDTLPNSPGWYFTPEVIAKTIELTKYLMKKYRIPAENVIRHYDVNGKCCPGIIGWNADSKSEYQWNEFKKKISE